MLPWDMKHVVLALESGWNQAVLLTGGVRVLDITPSSGACALPPAAGYPVVFDATHSVQTDRDKSGGQRQLCLICSKQQQLAWMPYLWKFISILSWRQ